MPLGDMNFMRLLSGCWVMSDKLDNGTDVNGNIYFGNYKVEFK